MRLTPWTTSKRFTASCYTPASWQLPTAGRAYLTSLEAMLETFNTSPLASHHSPRDTKNDLQWWLYSFSAEKKKLSRRIPGPCGLRTMARSLMLVPDLELRLSSKIAGEPGGSSWVGTLKGETLDGPKQLFSSSSSMLSSHLVSLASIVFRQVHDILSARECTGITRYVTSRENPADAPSRDIYPPTSVLLPLILIPGALRLLFTDLDSLPSHRELELRALGPRCSSMY
jgi:hypothetical protein